jgi:hypothetical protein
MLTINSGEGNVIRTVFTKLKQQLAPQTGNPKPKALVLPKSLLTPTQLG